MGFLLLPLGDSKVDLAVSRDNFPYKLYRYYSVCALIMEDAVLANVRDAVRDVVRDAVRDAVLANVRDVVRDAVRDPIREEMRRRERRHYVVLILAVILSLAGFTVAIYKLNHFDHELTRLQSVDKNCSREEQLERQRKDVQGSQQEIARLKENISSLKQEKLNLQDCVQNVTQSLRDRENQHLQEISGLKENISSLEQESEIFRQFLSKIEKKLQRKTEDVLVSHETLPQTFEKESDWNSLYNSIYSLKIGQVARNIYSSVFGYSKDYQEKRRPRNQTIVLEPTVSHTCSCKVHGPGLQSAIANHPTYLTMELNDASGQPCPTTHNITAQLEFNHYRPRFSAVQQPLLDSSFILVISTAVTVISPSQFNITFSAVTRGLHKVRILSSGVEIYGSFNITVYPGPNQLKYPVKVVTDVYRPRDVVINHNGDMIVSEWGTDHVSLFNSTGNRTLTYGVNCSQLHDNEVDRIECYFDDKPKERLSNPIGLSVDADDNIYVVSSDKLQKFSGDGNITNSFGTSCAFSERSDFIRHFRSPKGIALYNDLVYICDTYNHRIQVFDTNFTHYESDMIGSSGNEKGNFSFPFDLDFDDEGNLYVADSGNHRVQVFGTSDRFLRQFDHRWIDPNNEGGNLFEPSIVHIVGPFVYISDNTNNRIGIFNTTGKLKASFGGKGEAEGFFRGPQGLAFDQDGFLYVCDDFNNRIQIF